MKTKETKYIVKLLSALEGKEVNKGFSFGLYYYTELGADLSLFSNEPDRVKKSITVTSDASFKQALELIKDFTND